MIRHIFLFLFSLICVEETWAQSSELQRSFRGAVLGDSFDSVSRAIQSDALIEIDPNSDFMEFDLPNPNFIKAKLIGAFSLIYYEFNQGKLFALNLFFDKKKTSFEVLYKKLRKKYGKPTIFEPSFSTWENANTKIVLDQFTVRYIDKALFKQLQEEKNAKSLQNLPPDQIESIYNSL